MQKFKTDDDVCELFSSRLLFTASFLQLPSFEVSRFLTPYFGRNNGNFAY